jgi:hypothetical protein
MENHKEVFENFINENPDFANTTSHHRRLADWAYDTQFRPAVAAGKISYKDALIASRDAALELLPAKQKEHDTEQHKITITEMARQRNQTTRGIKNNE